MPGPRSSSSRRIVGLGLWLLAFVIMFGAASYQRRTGPTHPLRGTFELEGTQHRFRFPRSGTTGQPTRVQLPEGVQPAEAWLAWRRYPTSTDSFTPVAMRLDDGRLVAELPSQPPAGKVEYEVQVRATTGELVRVPSSAERPVLRYKDHVPLGLLIPHVAMMFFSMLFGVRAALAALTGRSEMRWLVPSTALGLTVGGLVLGPIVQKHAFGAYWTGWPLGNDLTDDKTLLMWAVWVVATVVVLRARHLPATGTRPVSPSARGARFLTLLATIVMLAVYLVPHSSRGSELDYDAVDRGARPEDAVRTGPSGNAP